MPLAALSEDADANTESPATLPTVVVTASRSPEDIQNTPDAVTVLTQDAILRRQAETPTNMLKEELGVWAVNVASQGSPIVRGQIGNRVLYLWDGIRINNGALFGGPNGFFNQFPLGAVDHMEIIRGSGSVQYGSDAIGGVINVLPKKSYFTDQLEFGGDLDSRFNTNNTGFTEMVNVHMTNDRLAVAAGMTRQDIGNYYGANVGTLSPTGFEATGGYLNAALKVTDNQTLRLSWIQNERDDVDAYVQSKLNANGVPRVFNPLERRGILKLEDALTDLGAWSSELKFYGYYQYYSQSRDRNVESTSTFSLTNTDTSQNIFGFGVQNTTDLDPVRLIYGVDYRTEDLSSTLSQVVTSNKTGDNTRSVPAGNTPDGLYDVLGIFETTEYRPFDCWLLSAGIRFENTQINSNPIASDVIPNAGYTIDSLDLSKSWQSFTWQVGSVYNVTKHWDLVANVCTAFRAPTYSDLFSSGAPVYASKIASVPNPTLDPETSITYEIGPRYHDDCFTASVTPYWTQINDLVVSATSGSVTIPGQGVYDATHNTNDGEGYVCGVEAAASYKLTSAWTLFGNATYTYGEDTSADVPLRFVPPLFGTVGIRYQSPGGRWWVEATEVMVAKFTRPATNDFLDSGFSTDPAFGSPNTTNNPPLYSDFHLPSYAITNLRGGVRVWQTDRSALDLTLDLNNIFNAQYREVYAQQQLVAPGFGAVIGARLTF